MPCSTKSSSVMNRPRNSTKMMIAIVADRTCGKSGHVTLRISAIDAVIERDEPRTADAGRASPDAAGR